MCFPKLAVSNAVCKCTLHILFCKALLDWRRPCVQVWDLNRGFNVGSFLTASSCNALAVSLDGALLVRPQL